MSLDNEEYLCSELEKLKSAMIARVLKLVSLSVAELRMLHPDNTEGERCFRASKEECIEAILEEEF